MRRSVRTVSLATSEYFLCPPRLPPPSGSHAAMAAGDSHTVTSPRWTSARSYEAQLRNSSVLDVSRHHWSPMIAQILPVATFTAQG